MSDNEIILDSPTDKVLAEFPPSEENELKDPTTDAPELQEDPMAPNLNPEEIEVADPELAEEVQDERVEEIKGKEAEAEAEEEEANEIEEYEIQEDPAEVDPELEARTLKSHQITLQELKEEIGRLNRQLDQRSKEPCKEATEEEVFKLKCLCKYSKQEVSDLNAKLEEIRVNTEKTMKNIETLGANSFSEEVSLETIEDLNRKIKALEEEYADLCKSSNEISITDLDKILVPEPNPKLVNEFFVNVQKRLGSLEAENLALSNTLKKSNQETLKLKEKCDKAAARYKSNDELKNKLKTLETYYTKYCKIEIGLQNDLQKAEEDFAIHHQSPENKFDAETAQKMLSEIEALVKTDTDEIQRLEFEKQEKEHMLKAARAYGIQRSKTSNKLRADMELLGLVLIEKEQGVLKIKKEIEELKWKQVQAEIEIKELNDKKIQL